MKQLHTSIERLTGVIFGTYRPASNVIGDPVWLVVAPKHEDRLFSVVLGKRGFYIGRLPKGDA